MRATVLILSAALSGCGGSAFVGLDSAPLDGAADSGPSALDQRTAAPEAGLRETGSVEAAVTTDAAPQLEAATGDAGPPVEAAAPEAGDGCAGDLSAVHGGDFHIEFDVLGVAGGGPLLEQRSACDQYSVHWLVAETAAGNIITQFYDGAGGPQLQSVATVDDGAWHHVVVARVALTFSITIDGQLDSSVPNAAWSAPALPLLQVGRSACAAPFGGQVRGACVSRP